MLLSRVALRSRFSIGGPPLPQSLLLRCSASSQAQPKPKEVAEFKKSRLSALPPKQPKREPFAKEFFCAKFDRDLLAYPEPQTAERFNEFQEWIETLKQYINTVNIHEFENSRKIPGHVMQSLREMGIFGSRIHTDYKGLNLLQSEFLQILEVVGKIPALGYFLLKHSVPGVDVLSNFGSVEQKLKRLPSIATGQSLVSVGVVEPTTGPSASNMKATAVLSNDEEYWTIDGEKTFVANADLADFFIVFAHALEANNYERRPELVSSFIVERDAKGLLVSEHPSEVLGLRGFNASRVLLRGVKVPRDHMIGQVGDGAKQIVEMFTNGRHYQAGLMVPLLRNYVDCLTQDVMNIKYFDKPMHDTAMARNAISQLNATIYAIESMLYFTSGLIDTYESQDMLLESALLEQFCLQEAVRAIQDTIWIVGSKFCSLASPYERLTRDAFTLASLGNAIYDTKVFSGLLGIGHTGIKTVEQIKKIRNPLQYPTFLVRKFFSEGRSNLKLEEHLHQSFRNCAEYCERTIYTLRTSTEELLIKYGNESIDQHADLMRLSDMVTLIYASVAVMSRASRSYCIGNRDSEFEIGVASILAYKYHKRVLEISEEMKEGRYINGDYASDEVSVRNIETKNYYFAHPLQRNY